MPAFQTEFEFSLPKGYVDDTGTVHKQGIMRLATAADEILPLKDPRVQTNPAYLTIILLARVITKLGTHTELTTHVVEKLFASDVTYLQDLYNRINGSGAAHIKAVCPKCEHAFTMEADHQGE